MKKSLLVAAYLVALLFPLAMGAYLINKDVKQSFADPQDNFEIVLAGDWRTASTDPDKVINPFADGGVNISYDAATNQTTVSYYGNEIPQDLENDQHFGFGYGTAKDHSKILREYWTRGADATDVGGGSTGFEYNPETGTVTVLIGNDTEFPTMISDVGFLIFDGEMPLDVMDRQGFPPDAFEPSGIPDGTILEPGDAVAFTLEGILPHNAIMVYQTVHTADPKTVPYLFDIGEWVQVLVERDLLVSTTGAEEHGSIESTKLLEVFSPGQGLTEIRYELPKAGKITLAVYSVSGERITTLVDETKDAGSYTIRWDANDIPAGVYIAKLSFDGVSAAEKMVHLK